MGKGGRGYGQALFGKGVGGLIRVRLPRNDSGDSRCETLLSNSLYELGQTGACVAALAKAEAAFAQLPVLAQDYCRSPWENWYRGCKKLNVETTLKKTRDVLEQARQAQAHAAQRESKP